MAIDGVKIIDSDDGYDIYNTVVDRYKNGENVEEIIEDVLNDEKIFAQTDFIQRFIGQPLLILCGR